MEEEKVKKDFNQEFKKIMLSVAMVAFTSMTIFIIWDIFFKIINLGYYFNMKYTLRFSCFISIVLYTLILTIVKKTSKATNICYIILFIVSFINQIKLSFSGEPLYLSDINFLGKVPSLLKLVTENISAKYVLNLLIVFLIFGLILAIIAFINKKTNLELKNKKARIIIAVIDIIILIILFFPTKTTKELFLKIFYNTDEYEDFNSYTTTTEYYLLNGIINGIYGIYLNNQFFEPDNYNEEELNNILAEVEDSNSNEETLGTPNIIVLFSESFWDIEQLDEVEFNNTVTSNYNRLKQEGKFINLISPTYGGMSENVAFELFTGCSMNSFSLGYIPIMSLYSGKSNLETTSIINDLKDNGYYSKILFGQDYYNCEDAYKTIGFDDYEELYSGNSDITDEYIINYVINDLENIDDDTNYLYVIETIEAHMPYSNDKYEEYDIEIEQSNLSEEANVTLRAYAQSIYNADIQLNRLYEYIQTLDEPTILVFLGDHLPHLLTENNEDVFDELEYFNTDDELLNYYRKYNTQSLILANYDINEIEFPEYLGTDVLINYLTMNMDIENSEYYKWLYTTINDLPASNRYISLDAEGNLYSTAELTGTMKETYDLRNIMQYKFFIK